MTEQIVKFETAKLAQEKGFDVFSKFGQDISLFTKDGEHTYYANYGFMYSGLSDGYIPAPTQSLVQKWLREIHKINVFVGFRMNVKKWDGHAYDMNLSGKEYVKIQTLQKYRDRPPFDTYEEAFEYGIIEGLSMIINK